MHFSRQVIGAFRSAPRYDYDLCSIKEVRILLIVSSFFVFFSNPGTVATVQHFVIRTLLLFFMPFLDFFFSLVLFHCFVLIAQILRLVSFFAVRPPVSCCLFIQSTVNLCLKTT